jgi:hypothetical protein
LAGDHQAALMARKMSMVSIGLLAAVVASAVLAFG